MPDRLLLIPPITLAKSLPANLPIPKFQIGQRVFWAYVPSHDFGQIVGLFWAAEGSVNVKGYHYAVQLDPASPSAADNLTHDWAFEADLALLPELHPLSKLAN